jgi:cation-transporting ATPase 13A1
LKCNGTGYTVLKRYPFDSNLRRMTVLGQKSNSKGYFIFCKGAPETLETLLNEVPDGYKETYEHLAQKGYRVLCLARREIPSGSHHAIQTMSRLDAESKLEFQGFIALDSPLKADSEHVVRELKQSGHRVIIITGDNDATAREVGRRLRISDGTSMTGMELEALMSEKSGNPKEVIIARIKECSVFARVSPAQKEQIISLFSQAGMVTLMCGDGTNDAGALKRADVGVSVISHPFLERVAREETGLNFEELLDEAGAHVQLGDASIASPFTAKTPHVSAVLDIVRQGRCTLVTTIQMFKILAANGLVHSITMTVLFLQGVRQGDTQSTIFGLIVAVVFALLSFAQPQQELTSRRPISRIFSSAVIASIVGQSLIHLLTLFTVCSLAESGQIDNLPQNPDAEFKPNQVNTIVYITGFVIQANIFAVNYRGHPFMTSFLENKKFSRTIFFMWAFAFFLASGVAPESLLQPLELVVLPDVHLKFVSLLTLDTMCSFLWEWMVVRNVLGG